jgi:ABC-type Fe3+/spermidine/putrescine transport system ATPase subunit
MEIRTESQGITETAYQFTRLVLHHSQLSILNCTDSFIFLVGPPGCGKSLCLMLKGLYWLSRGRPVLVASFDSDSLAASHMLFGQLQHSAEPEASRRVHFYRSVP